jgi:hypothetical protein
MRQLTVICRLMKSVRPSPLKSPTSQLPGLFTPLTHEVEAIVFGASL